MARSPGVGLNSLKDGSGVSSGGFSELRRMHGVLHDAYLSLRESSKCKSFY